MSSFATIDYSDWSTSATVHSACTSGFVTSVEAKSSPKLVETFKRLASTASIPGQQQDAAVAYAFENQTVDFQFLEEIGLWPKSSPNLVETVSVGETLGEQ